MNTFISRVMVLVFAVMLWTSVGLASEQWEPCGSQTNIKLYIDTNSVSFRPTTRNDIYKARIKSVVDNDTYAIRTLLVNADTKEYSYVYLEMHSGSKVRTVSYKHDDWLSNDYENIGAAIDKVIDIGNKQRVN